MNVKKNIKELFLYLIVGAVATLAEWIAFYIFNEKMSIYYMTATAIAFALSTFVNWIVGKWLLFHEKQNVAKELVKIYLTSIAGLLFNLLIMWVAIEVFSIPNFISKVIATGLVFMWNFLVRKLFIYKTN